MVPHVTSIKVQRKICLYHLLTGFAKVLKIHKIRDNFGSGWVGPGLIRKKNGKSSQNSRYDTDIFELDGVGGWVVRVSSIQHLFGIFDFF